jgi:hypothetical protein
VLPAAFMPVLLKQDAGRLVASPAEVAAMVADGIRSRRFYILTSGNRNEAVLRRGQEIVAGGPPEPPVSFA